MNKPVFLIEVSQLDLKNTMRIEAACRKLGYTYTECAYVPLIGGIVTLDSSRRLVEVPERTPVIFNGSINLCRWVQRNHPAWFPFAWCNWDELKCSAYYAHWGKYLISQKHAFFHLWAIKPRLDWVYRTFGVDDRVFIRPDDNAKSFDAEVVHRDHFDAFLAGTGKYGTGANSLCVVAEPVEIVEEWRVVVANRKPVTGSTYRRNGEVVQEPGYGEGVRQYCELVANSTDWQPAPIYCLDVALLSDGSIGLVEVSGVNTAGLYESDMETYVKHAAEIAKVEWSEAYGDS